MTDLATRILTTITTTVRNHRLFAAGPSVTPDTLLEEITDDSLARIEIGFAIEEEFGVEVPDAEIERWVRVADIMASVRDRVGEGVG